jgi:hypothetical protein
MNNHMAFEFKSELNSTITVIFQTFPSCVVFIQRNIDEARSNRL